MGLFSRTPKAKKLDWQDLTSVDQLSDLIQSGEKTLIFKHSTRCSISSMALNQLENNWNGSQENIYYLDLLQYRDVSNRIATELNVVHQSPQAIVFQGNEVFYQASHSSISARDIEKALT